LAPTFTGGRKKGENDGKKEATHISSTGRRLKTANESSNGILTITTFSKTEEKKWERRG